MPKTLYLIDGHAQIYRAYYAPFGNLTSPTGEPTRATHVFFQTLINLLRDRKPDYLAMVLDADESKLLRREIYPEYKAHREPSPEDFHPQEERIVSTLEAVKMPILRLVGHEADDILATIASRMASPDLHVFLVSRDKDLEQLLTVNITMFDPFKGEDITPQRLVELKGWRPEQAVEAQTLIGDPVDNVPGVPGIGPKTAAKLLEKYGSAQGVVDHAAELTPKQRENVLAFAPLMERTRQLVTLRRDVPVTLDLDACLPSRFDWSAARRVFEQLGMRKLPDLLPQNQVAVQSEQDAGAREAGLENQSRERQRTIGSKPLDQRGESPILTSDRSTQAERESDLLHMAVAQQTAIDTVDFPPNLAQSGGVDDAARAAIEALAAPLRKPDGGEYLLVNTPEAFDAFATNLAAQTEFAVDTETTGLNAMDADLVGLSFAWEVGKGYYLPVRCAFGGELSLSSVRARLGPILASAATRKVGHHLKFDLKVLRQVGLPVGGPLFDTMIAAFVAEPQRSSFGLDGIVHSHLAHSMIPITDLIGRGKQQMRMDQVPLTQISEYAAEDADYTWRLRQLYEPQIAPAGVEKLFYELEMPLATVLLEMEYNGIAIDAAFLGEMEKQMAVRCAAITDEVHKLAGGAFNLDSTKQLAEVLFDRLGLRVVRMTRTARSTDAETLEALHQETGQPILGLLLEYREIQKLLGTYVTALPAARSKRTGRVHTNYSQTAAVTGRLASSDPNLQNIPIRTEMGRQIRKAFIPRSPAERLVVADYSQIELRVLAHFCEDENLIRAFQEDRDIHAVVAAQVNGVALEAVTREMRGRAKAVNFGIIYGQTAFGLAQGTGMSRTEAQTFIDEYFKRYAGIKQFIDRCIEDARRDGFVRTLFGRKRPIENLDSRNRAVRALGERLAVNTVIQGSAADLLKIAMIRLHERIQREQLPLRMLLQVHDELVCEAPHSEAAAMGEIVRDVMSGAMALRVPLKVDLGIGENWLEAK